MKIENAIGNVQLIRKINRLKVLDFIRRMGPVARPEIAKSTGLSPSSITNIVNYLLDKNLVAEMGLVDSNEVGRKATLIKFNPSAFNIISIDIESEKINLALTDLEGNIIEFKQIPIVQETKDFEILDIIKKEISLVISVQKNVAGIGIAVSGLIQDEEKLILSTSHKWRGLSLKEIFQESFGVPVFVQNNSRTKALWKLNEFKGGTERNIIFLDLSFGVGIINFYDHKINDTVIGEFGHTTVKKDGPLCFCGNHGCLELMCTVDAVINQCSKMLSKGKCLKLKKLLGNNISTLSYMLVLEAFKQGDEDVCMIMKECGEYLGIGLANIINIFRPQRIIINDDTLLDCDYIYKTAVEESNIRAHEYFVKGLNYERVYIDSEQATQGVSLYVADKLFDLAGPEI